MKTKIWLFAIAATITFAACGPKTYVTKDNSYDLTKVRNYAWVPAQRDSLVRSRTGRGNDLVNSKIKASIDKNLAANGWLQVRRNPDVFVVYEVNVSRENINVSDPVYSQPMTRYYYNPYRRVYVPVYYPSSLMGYNNTVQTVNEGTITLTVIDRKTDKTIWQGSAVSDINGRRMTDNEIDDYTKAIVKKLLQ